MYGRIMKIETGSSPFWHTMDEGFLGLGLLWDCGRGGIVRVGIGVSFCLIWGGGGGIMGVYGRG